MPNYIQLIKLLRTLIGGGLDYFCTTCSLVRNSDGNWYVPYANWNGSSWNRNANWLGNSWNANYRIVLLVTFYLFQIVQDFSSYQDDFVLLTDSSNHITFCLFLLAFQKIQQIHFLSHPSAQIRHLS